MSFSIEYKLEEAGWGIIRLSNEETSYESAVSYLHDSLGDLAHMAVQIRKGESKLESIFMDEPGELQLRLDINNNLARYEGRSYSDWASWGMASEENYELVISGICTKDVIVEQIAAILTKLYESLGPDEYKEKCPEHEFPIDHYRELTHA